jgi:EpsI family protein
MYKNGTDELGLFIAYYAQQKAGESMHSPKHCLPGSGWEIWDYAATAIPTVGTPTTVNRYSIANSGQRMVVLYWYQSRNRIITSEYAGKLYLLKDGIVDGRTSGSLVRITVPDTPDAIKAAEKFASQLIPLLNNCLGGRISA